MGQTPSARPTVSAIGRLERMARRDARDRARQERLADRQRSAAASASAVTAHETRVERLTTCHRVTLTGVDWIEAASRGEMEAPVRKHLRELKARKALTAYRPGFVDSIFGLEQGKRRDLAVRVAVAASADEAEYQTERRVAETHNADIHLAKKLLDLDIPTLEKSLPTRTRLAEISDLWEGVGLASPTRGWLVATVGGLSLDDMPDEVPFVTPLGKALFKPMAMSERTTLHRAHLCAVALRVTVELMTALPVEGVEVVVEIDVPAEDGQFDRPRVLALRVARPDFAQLKLEGIEPMAGVAQLDGRMNWTAEGGFASLDCAPPAAAHPTTAAAAPSAALAGLSPAAAAYRHSMTG